ncbi:hypothetical protein FRC98_06255 [Lujinxingia vulgaris]|uniref:Glycosyl transferase family 51 domain-containing protein n=1 Tax=Lujinxingia vulgaris TaxID=2600176 RepID=A0A5C6X9I0_9DELT|nr:biosynthetic peptidoglycan transglycosylase [Lujinxingia vulgaris]TXD38481.1 hypothetical protein FRC98_06255 [Lujinxingia vulgaris]
MTNDTAGGAGGRSSAGRLLKIAGGALIALLLLGAGAWLMAPKMARRVLDSQLERVEARSGLTIKTGALETRGLSGVTLSDLQVAIPGDDAPVVTIARAEVSLGLLAALKGDRAISALALSGVRVELSYDDQGRHTLTRILELQGDDEAEGDASESVAPRDLEAIAARLQERALRHFGGRFPQVEVRDLEVGFSDVQTPSRWPLTQLKTELATLESGESRAPFEADVHLQPNDAHTLSLPATVSLSGALALPLTRSSVDVTFSEALRARAPAPYDFLEVELRGVAITDNFGVALRELALRNRLEPGDAPMVEAELASLALESWPARPADVKLQELRVEGPHLRLNYAAHGASNLGDLEALLRRGVAKRSVRTAREVAQELAERAIADASKDDAAEDDTTDATPAAEDLDALAAQPAADATQPAGPSLRELLTEKLPQRIKVSDLTIEVVDPRPHDNLNAPLQRFALREGELDVDHRPIQGQIDLKAIAHIEGAVLPARVDVALDLPYRKGGWEAKVDIEELELSQLAQLGGERIASRLFGGRVNASLDLGEGEQRGRTSFEGMFALDGFRAFLSPVAADPIELGEASIALKGYLDPKAAIPPARLLKAPTPPSEPELQGGEEELSQEELPAPPERGAFVIDEGTARHRDASAEFQLAIYGFDGLDRRPNRLDVAIAIEPTPVQALVDAIPSAILGPLAGMRLAGTFGWNFAMEVPLYDAGRMQWDATPELLNLEVKHLPEEVDVYRLFERFDHTIEDTWEVKEYRRTRTLTYQRDIVIPKMRPTPAPWLIENTGITLEELDLRRRERGWPEVPQWFPGLGIPRQAIDSPEYWLTRHATSQAAPRPWPERAQPVSALDSFFGAWSPQPSPDVPRWEAPEPHRRPLEETIDAERYGDYVYVPLHHISPYMVRAILTTEDNSFFDHPGFNFYAIKQSVAANLRAGRFVRGASTISMQLAKNLFLDREKVLARKFQEATLVWLMESVADIPKERLLEIYLNIIEYGPGVFGIHEAAVHYFGKRPDELSIGEVAWLVSIIPGPKRYHSYYDRGEISPAWFRRMGRYIRAMETRERITPEEMELALAEPPAFHIPADGEPIFRADYERENPPPPPEVPEGAGEGVEDLGGEPTPEPVEERGFMRLFD